MPNRFWYEILKIFAPAARILQNFQGQPTFPPLFHILHPQGGEQPCVGRRPIFFSRGFCVKIGWTTLRKRSKSMIFAKEIAFCKRKTPKFSRLRRGYTPSNYSKHWWRCSKSKYSKCNYSKSNYSNIVHEAALSKQFSNLQAAIALSTHECQSEVGMK